MTTQFRENIAFLGLVILLFFLLHFKTIDRFPSGIHAWAQSDRYALALGFVENNLNFFKPQTFVLNHQFPNNWLKPYNESITAVDFPIHDYIPAVVMKIIGSTSVSVFRIYIMLYGFVGLFFLFKLATYYTLSIYKSIVVVLFAATSPVFAYYHSGFLPSIPSLANAIIGIYFYLMYFEEKKPTQFIQSIVFLTLATLSRSTFAIALVAVVGVEFTRFFFNDTKKIQFVPMLISFAAIGAYMVYNSYLRSVYGSDFLNRLLPAANVAEAIELLKQVYANWRKEYFTLYHYIAFVLVFLFSLFFILKRKEWKQRKFIAMSLLATVILIGELMFTALMLRQFPAHDYYFLDTFFLPILLIFILCLSTFPTLNFKYSHAVSVAFVCVLGLALVSKATEKQTYRYTVDKYDPLYITTQNFTDSEAFLNANGVDKKAKILVIDAYAPNIPFILLHRKGFAILSTSKSIMEKSLTWNFDYIIVQNEFFVSDIYNAFPEIISKIEKIADNGKISLCKLSPKPNNQTLLGFLGIENQTPVFEYSTDFETDSITELKNVRQSSDFSFSGNSSTYLSSKMEFGITFKRMNMNELAQKSRTLICTAYFYTDSIADCEMVASIQSGNENLYYKSFNIKELVSKQHKWQRAELHFFLPKTKGNQHEFGLYIWNRGKARWYIDDFSFSIY